ncbi:MAG: response regulator [Candidatus Tectomicrobia bacterium]|nr:response regulator [Candidatus Tectomicrobia bacterium]
MLRPESRYYDFSGLTALIVDDHPVLRAAVREILKNYRCHDVRMAADGQEAINVIGETNKLDLVICDVEMKPMNGLQLAKAIRADLTGAPYDIPIVMLTAHSERQTVRAAVALHVNGFVVKPVRPMLLAEKIDWVLRNPLSIDPIVPEDHDVDVLPSERKKAPHFAPSAGKAAEPPAAPEMLPEDVIIVRTKEEFDELRRKMVERVGYFKAKDLRAGSIVAQDVLTPAGAILLKKGMTLTEEIIDVVRGHGALGEILVLQ